MLQKVFGQQDQYDDVGVYASEKGCSGLVVVPAPVPQSHAQGQTLCRHWFCTISFSICLVCPEEE